MITHGDHQRLLHITGAVPTGPALCRKKQSFKFGVGAEKHLFKNTFVGARPCDKHRALIAAERRAAFSLLSWISPSLKNNPGYLGQVSRRMWKLSCWSLPWVDLGSKSPRLGHMWCWSVTANITSHPVSRQTQLPMNWSYTSQRESSGMWRVRITETVRNTAFNLRQQMSAVEYFSCITSQLNDIWNLKTQAHEGGFFCQNLLEYSLNCSISWQKKRVKPNLMFWGASLFLSLSDYYIYTSGLLLQFA